MKRKIVIFIMACTFIFGSFASKSMAATYSLTNLVGTWYITLGASEMEENSSGDRYVGEYTLFFIPIKISSTGVVSSGGTGYAYEEGGTSAIGTIKATGGTLKISTTTGVVSGTIKTLFILNSTTYNTTTTMRYGVMNTSKNIISGLMMSTYSIGTFTATKR